MNQELKILGVTLTCMDILIRPGVQHPFSIGVEGGRGRGGGGLKN